MPATKEQVVADAQEYIRVFRESNVDELETRALAAGAAIAERLLAEPTAKPAQTPEEAAEIVRQLQREAGLRPAEDEERRRRGLGGPRVEQPIATPPRPQPTPLPSPPERGGRR